MGSFGSLAAASLASAGCSARLATYTWPARRNASRTVALEEYIAGRARARILDSRGQFDDWDPDYDSKEERRSRDHKLGVLD